MGAAARGVHVRFGVLAAAVVALYAWAPPAVRAPVMVLASAGAMVRVLHRLRDGRLGRPLPWWFVMAGLAALTVNNVVWFLQVDLGDAIRATGPVAAVGMPLGYVLLLVASILIVSPIARRDSGGVIDAALIAIGCSIVLWTVVIFPTLEERGTPTGVRAYDLLVILVVGGITGAVVRAATASRAARGSLGYLLVAVLLTLVGNAVSMAASDVAGRPPEGLGAVWVLGYLALGAAAGHPSSAVVTTPSRAWEGRLSSGRLAFLGVALAINPVVGGVRAVTGQEADWLLLSVGSLVLVPLVLLRVSQLARLHADAERRLAHLADHDALTGLPNRRAVDRHVETVLRRVHAREAPGAVVLFLDLDDFKAVNDTLGHRVGDQLLAAVAERLCRCVRAGSGDLVARFGGDEFVLVLEGDPTHLADDAARRVREALAVPFEVGDHVLPGGGSIGVATVLPGDGTTVDQVLSAADARMYEHKRERRDERVAERVAVAAARTGLG